MEIGRRSSAGETSFNLPIFDGLRRYDLAVTAIAQRHHTIKDKEYDTIDLAVAFHPVGGFKPRQLDFWKNAAFEVLVGRDNDLPLAIATLGFTLTTVISLYALCPADTPCPPAAPP